MNKFIAEVMQGYSDLHYKYKNNVPIAETNTIPVGNI